MSVARGGLLLALLLVAGCGKESTAGLIEKLKAPEAGTRLIAARNLGQRPAEAAQVVPALAEALMDEDEEVRKAAAFSLGALGERAREAVPALREAQRDRAADVRKAASVALSYIDPDRFPPTGKAKGK